MRRRGTVQSLNLVEPPTATEGLIQPIAVTAKDYWPWNAPRVPENTINSAGMTPTPVTTDSRFHPDANNTWTDRGAWGQTWIQFVLGDPGAGQTWNITGFHLWNWAHVDSTALGVKNVDIRVGPTVLSG